MKVAAIIALSGVAKSEFDSSGTPSHVVGQHLAVLPGVREMSASILGHNLLDRMIGQLHELGVSSTIVSEAPSFTHLLANSTDAFSAWERALNQALRQEVDVLLLLCAGDYIDFAYAELLDSHCASGAILTQAYTADGPLEVVAVNPHALQSGGSGGSRSRLTELIPAQNRYFHDGYSNALGRPDDFMRLIDDALYERCALRPVGTEVRPGIWLGEDAVVDDSCLLNAPCFIGAGTRIGACCAIGGGVAIERGCKIDSGTSIEGSWVRPGTYIGVGLNVRRSIVNNRKIFHLDRKTEVMINDRRLIGTAGSRSFVGAGSALLSKLQLNGFGR